MSNTTSASCTVNHVGIVVSDCDAAVQWYARVFDMHQFGSAKQIPGEMIPPWSLFRRSKKPLQAMKIAFIGNQSITLEIVEFIRDGETGSETTASNEKGEIFHIALTVSSPAETASMIERTGGGKLGDVAKLPNGISFVHCLDPWDNPLELMDGRVVG